MPIPVWACRVSWRVWFGQPFTISSTQQVKKKCLFGYDVLAGERRRTGNALFAFCNWQHLPACSFSDRKKRTSRVFKYRLFQSQRVNMGQRGAQDIRLGVRAYTGDRRVPEKLGPGRASGLQVEISFMVKWKRVFTLTNRVLCGPDRHICHDGKSADEEQMSRK